MSSETTNVNSKIAIGVSVGVSLLLVAVISSVYILFRLKEKKKEEKNFQKADQELRSYSSSFYNISAKTSILSHEST